jgi:hypothetical protein
MIACEHDTPDSAKLIVQLNTTWQISATYRAHATLGSPSFGWRPITRTTVTIALKLEALKFEDAITSTPEPVVRRNAGLRVRLPG